jgi:23S rRNA (uracil1939-C5)-methyltransferase
LQPNPAVASLAYSELLDPGAVVDSELAYDLYAGAGVTTVALRERFAEVRACESFAESAARLDIEAQTAEEFLATALASGEKPAFIVANPPRAGMGPEVCASLVECGRRGPLALNIMSCNPKSLSADLERLTVDGGFELVSLRAYDTLPQTPHVELVARLRAGA